MSTPRTAPIVVKIGGSLLDEPNARSTFVRRVAAATESMVLVHGGGAAVDRHLARIGITTERVDGIRITPPTVVPEIAGVLAGQVGTMLVSDLRRAGATAIGLRLGDEPGIDVVPLGAHFDPGAVGTVGDGTAPLIQAALELGHTPVIASIGFLSDGTPVNVNADDAAAGVARALDAQALLLLTDVAGVLDRDGATLPRLAAGDVDRLVAEETIRGGMIPKIRGAVATATAIGRPVVIGHWNDPNVLHDPLGSTGCTVVHPTNRVRPIAEREPQGAEA